MRVGLVGSGPAADAVEAALGDVGAEAVRCDPWESADVGGVVVVDSVGASAFDRVDRMVDGSWVAVELGGVGGRAVEGVDAAASVLDPGGGCFECLRARVASNLGEEAETTTTSRSDARLAGAIAGRLASDLVRGESPAGRVVELPYAERRLLPVPGCDCGSPIDRTLARGDDSIDLDEAAARAERAVDARIGIVRSVGEAESFPAPYYLATLPETTGFSEARAGPQAAGVSADWNEAFVKATGEALERYSAGVYRTPWFEVAPASELDRGIEPSRFVLPDDYPDPDPEEPIAWVPGEDLATGERATLPAEFVQFPPPEARHKPPITTGLGLGSSGSGALLSGLYEAVERDATMLSWYSTFEPLPLDVSDPEFGTLERRARSEGLETTALLVTQDVDVPVVSVAVHRDGEWPEFAVGSGADLDATRAARSALAEALQNWMELRGMGPDGAAEEGAIGRYADFPREVRSFVDIGNGVPIDAVGPDDPPAGAGELDAVVERVADAGLDAYATRITTPDVEALGFEAVRVLVPGAQPLFTDDRYFGERARRVPRELGFRPRLDRAPHPYP